MFFYVAISNSMFFGDGLFYFYVFFQVADGLMSIHLSTSNPNLLTMDEPIVIGTPAGNGMSSDTRDFDRLLELFYHQAEKGFNYIPEETSLLKLYLLICN